MFYDNTLNLKQELGGSKIKQGDFGSVLSFILLDGNNSYIDELNQKTASISLCTDDKILYVTTATINNSTVEFKIDKAIPVGVYYVEIKVDNYIFPSDRSTIISIEQGATVYDLKDLIPNYDVSMTLTDILNKLNVKDGQVVDLQNKMNAIYNNALSDHSEILNARETFATLDSRLDELDAKDTDLQSQINTNKTGISNTNSRIDNLIVTAGNGNSGEVNDLRVDINGLTHTTAGDAVRSQFSAIDDLIKTGQDAGLIASGLEYASGYDVTSNNNTSSLLTQGATPSQAYDSGFLASEDILLTGIKLDSRVTSTQFSIFVLSQDNKIVTSLTNLNPAISDNEFSLGIPIIVKKGSRILMRFLNGVFFYKNTGSSTYKEYVQGTNTVSDSPILAAYNIKYQTQKLSFSYGKVKTSDYLLPKFKEIEGAYGLVGRWFKKNNGSVPTDATNNQGSIIYTKVSGATQVTVSLTPFTTPNNPYFFAYSIDGGAFTRQNMTNGVIALPNNGEHIIQIVLDGLGENDPVGGGKWIGSLGVFLNGITVDAGEVKGILPKNKVGIYIGDSITEGINVLTTGAIGASNSATGSYTWISSKKLNAIPYYIGYGGTSTLGNASFHKAIEAIDYFYNGVKSNTPDVDFIVMAHGYNDNTLINNGTYTVQQYKDAYNKVMDRLKVKYAGCPIFCVVPFGAQAIKPYIQECIANRPYCYLIETDGISVSTTDGVHPNSDGSIVLGNHIADSIKSKLGTSYFID